ncbi:hypothetical protein LguiA_030700 [Lonicera macranthoides]
MSSIYTNLVLTLFIALLNLPISNPTYTNETDMHALLAFKSNFQDPLGALNSWNDSVHFCSWQGVSCGRRHRRVTALNLNASGLVGPLSPYIGNLSFIRVIRLANNTLQGELPSQIGHLFRLQDLSLPFNSLEGKIPTNLSQLSSLGVLNLVSNKIEGGIPRELGGLPKLWELSLWSAIPISLSNASDLEHIEFANNSFVGKVPANLGSLQRLRVLLLSINSLGRGEADEANFLNSLTNCTMLERLEVLVNRLGGTLPNSVGNLSIQLRSFGVADNQMYGEIPMGFEYGLGSKVSMKGDVYSYGILLLEMITERSPIDPVFANGLSLYNYALNALPDRVMEIVKLKLPSNHGDEVLPTASNNNRSGEESREGNQMKECLVSMIKIGVSCSMDSPQNRMDLTDVIRELYFVKRILEELEA